MYVIVWTFRPRPGRAADFEWEYGPAGSWAALFRDAPGYYLGTDLLRAADGSGHDLTVDRWKSSAAYEAFRVARRAEYEALDRARPSFETPRMRKSLLARWPSRSRTLFPLVASQSAARPSESIVTNILPSGAKANSDAATRRTHRSAFVGR